MEQEDLPNTQQIIPLLFLTRAENDILPTMTYILQDKKILNIKANTINILQSQRGASGSTKWRAPVKMRKITILITYSTNVLFTWRCSRYLFEDTYLLPFIVKLIIILLGLRNENVNTMIRTCGFECFLKGSLLEWGLSGFF